MTRKAEPEGIEIAPEVIDGVVDVFWDFFGDRLPVTYDARPFALEVARRVVSLQVCREAVIEQEGREPS